ncbi:MAG: glycerol-3-phosphate 1-O-acyltransferase PlsY [Clostridia bacterium]|jgi:glycerol-3-phosphate acyltransferase PlsY|nr:glycerol-3-phosphate 1-O-acyltransferase PlsY [Clostridia bacterium]
MLYLYLTIGYLIGCLQTSYIIGKLKGKIDIRDYGSGNAGTTNMIRVMGPKYGAITFVGDVVKMILAVNLVAYFFDHSITALFVTGLGVIVGHDWPVFLKFRGGKGIASLVGFLLAYNEKVALLIILIMIATIVMTRFISLASIFASLLFPLAVFLKGEPSDVVSISILIMIINIYKHRGNIVRLINGNERRIGEKNE